MTPPRPRPLEIEVAASPPGDRSLEVEDGDGSSDRPAQLHNARRDGRTGPSWTLPRRPSFRYAGRQGTRGVTGTHRSALSKSDGALQVATAALSGGGLPVSASHPPPLPDLASSWRPNAAALGGSAPQSVRPAAAFYLHFFLSWVHHCIEHLESPAAGFIDGQRQCLACNGQRCACCPVSTSP
jgi:hypothetical protein